MTTVNQLIQQLQEIEDKEQPIVFQYYIAEHFIDPETDDNMEPKRFEKVADEVEQIVHFWDDNFEEIANIVNELENDNE